MNEEQIKQYLLDHLKITIKQSARGFGRGQCLEVALVLDQETIDYDYVYCDELKSILDV